ncbi:aminotransferase class V-fold PLP-dependent enzyme [Candidatus Woesearchaeota archaeon]|nr:aminotransferase class V-fold PLP-dependent enzyme [Candidatus Woesearchaeota archaeon]
MNKKEMKTFWTKQVKPRFTHNCLNFKVTLLNGKKVRYVNFDNAATTSPFKKVKENVDKFLDVYGSVHRGSGQKSEISTNEYENARDFIAKSVGADKDYYVILTKNTTEAINQAAELFHFMKGKVLVSDIEHSSNLLPWLKYNKTIIYRTNEKNKIDYDKLIHIFEKHKGEKEENKIKLLTVVGASNVTGYKPDLDKLAKMAHKYGAYILVDACQLLQHENINMRPIKDKSHLDFIAFSGHKMYAPYGGGCLIGPKKFFDKAPPYQIGGGNLAYITSDFSVKKFDTVQTHDPGTPNAVGIISMADAMKELNAIGLEKISTYEHALVNYTFSELRKLKEITIYSDQSNNPSMILFDINGFDYRLTAEILAKEFGIGTRAGSFCVYQLLRKLKDISLKEEEKISVEIEQGSTVCMPGIVRASFAIYNKVEDVDRLIEALKEIIKKGINHYIPKYTRDKINGAYILKSKLQK